MKYRKKQQKKILDFTILLLFMLVLNVNFTVTVKNLEPTYSEDTYEEFYKDLSPEIIVESPKNANYIEHLDFMPYGTYIYAPKYFQRYVGQTGQDYIRFRLYDANGGDFSKFEIYIDGVLAQTIDWPYYSTDFNINYLLSTEKVYNITTKALSNRSNKWVTHNSILNVTSSAPCIAPFYDDFMHLQNWWDNLEWNIYTSNNRNYNYTIYINGTESHFENRNYWDNYINFDYTNDINFNSNLNEVNEIKLVVKDETGEETINQFKVKNVVDSEPYIQSLDRNCENIGHLTLWETEGFSIRTSAYAPNNDLDKIVMTVNNIPIYTIENAINYETYDAPININILGRFRDEWGNLNTNLDFRAIAITKDGRSSNNDWAPTQYMELRYYDYPQLIVKTEEVTSGRNIETLEITEEYDSEIDYTLTVVTDLITPTTLTIAGSTGRTFEDSGYMWEHCYDEYSGDCNIFGDFEKNNNWYRGGMVFWVNAANRSAIQFPMIVKIIYPEEIQPDEINKNWNLQFMQWLDNCENYDRRWIIYRNKTISTIRDETIKQVGDNAVEILIYSPGLYAFGMEPGDNSYSNNDFFIPGFPVGLIIFSFGIAALTFSLKLKSKMKMK